MENESGETFSQNVMLKRQHNWKQKMTGAWEGSPGPSWFDILEGRQVNFIIGTRLADATIYLTIVASTDWSAGSHHCSTS